MPFTPISAGSSWWPCPRGGRIRKMRVAPDSLWGYVSGKGRTIWFYRGEEYHLEFADTLCVCSSTTVLGGNARWEPVILRRPILGGRP